MQKLKISSNVKMPISFTINLNNLPRQQPATERKKSKTHRVSQKMDDISPMRLKKKSKNKHTISNSTNLTKQKSTIALNEQKQLNQQYHELKSSLKQNKVKQTKQKQANTSKKLDIKKKSQFNNTISNKKVKQKVENLNKKKQIDKIKKIFTQYDHLTSARLTTSPNLNLNYHSISKSNSKSISRSRSKSYKNSVNNKLKERSKSIITNDKFNTLKLVTKLKKQKNYDYSPFQKKQKKSKSKDKITNMRPCTSRQRIYTQRSEYSPLRDKDFNTNSSTLKQKPNKKTRQRLLTKKIKQSQLINWQKLTSTKINQKKNQKKTSGKSIQKHKKSKTEINFHQTPNYYESLNILIPERQSIGTTKRKKTKTQVPLYINQDQNLKTQTQARQSINQDQNPKNRFTLDLRNHQHNLNDFFFKSMETRNHQNAENHQNNENHQNTQSHQNTFKKMKKKTQIPLLKTIITSFDSIDNKNLFFDSNLLQKFEIVHQNKKNDKESSISSSNCFKSLYQRTNQPIQNKINSKKVTNLCGINFEKNQNIEDQQEINEIKQRIIKINPKDLNSSNSQCSLSDKFSSQKVSKQMDSYVSKNSQDRQINQITQVNNLIDLMMKNSQISLNQSKVIQSKVIQSNIKQRKMIQEKVIQGKVIQERVIQEKVIQGKVIQGRVIKQKSIPNLIIQLQNRTKTNESLQLVFKNTISPINSVSSVNAQNSTPKQFIKSNNFLSYGQQNSKKIVNMFNKPRKSFEEQVFNANNQSNKRLLKQLQSLENSKDFIDIINQHQFKHQLDDHLKNDFLKQDQQFINLEEIIITHKPIQQKPFQQQLSEKQKKDIDFYEDSPLLSSNENFSARRQSNTTQQGNTVRMFSSLTIQFQKEMDQYLAQTCPNKSLSQSSSLSIKQVSSKVQQQKQYQIECISQPLSQPMQPSTHSQLLKIQLTTHILNHLLQQFTNQLHSNPNLLHKFIYLMSHINMVQEKELDVNRFQEYIMNRIQAGNQFVVRHVQELFHFIKHHQHEKQMFLNNINMSYGLKPLVTLKWLRKAIPENQHQDEDNSNNQDQQQQEQDSLCQSSQIQVIFSSTILADFDSYKSQIGQLPFNQDQYYMNHAIYGALNQIGDRYRPYGQSGHPVIKNCTYLPTTSIESVQKKIINRLKYFISLRMGRNSFSIDQQPQIIIAKSYKLLDAMFIQEEDQRWTDQNMEDLILQGKLYLTKYIIEQIINQEILEIQSVLFR